MRKRTWQAVVEDLAVSFGGLTVRDVTVECVVFVVRGEAGDRITPQSPPTAEISDIRVVSLDWFEDASGERVHGSSALFKELVRKHLLDTGWHERDDVLAECLAEIGAEIREEVETGRER